MKRKIEGFERKISAEDDGKRKKKGGYMVTDKEDRMIKEMCRNAGFDKPRDFLVCLASFKNIEGNIPKGCDGGYYKHQYEQMRIRIGHIGTWVNMIDSGIDDMRTTNKLIEEVRELCRIYR